MNAVRFTAAALLVLALLTSAHADKSARYDISPELRAQCLKVLRTGLHGDDFWPAIHAAEGLTLGGQGDEVRRFLTPKLATEKDDQRRCGLARELVRAGDRAKASVMLDILAKQQTYGHVHAAESLYKVFEIGDGKAMRRAFEGTKDLRLKLMSGGALARWGNPGAMAFLRATLDDDDAEPETLRIAAWLLGRIGGEQDIVPLRAGLARAKDELTRAYVEHSLAALGDKKGQDSLRRNLRSPDPAVRTYAATFLGDARMIARAAELIPLLEDPHPDARYRAAQSLLWLSRPAPLDRQTDITRNVYEASDKHPRYTEGSILHGLDGSLLYATTQFVGSGSDFAKARIVARSSSDGGRSWGDARVLQENTGGMNVMSATLKRIDQAAYGKTVALFYLQKNSFDDLHCFVRFSSDEGRTFGKPTRVTLKDGYHVVNNDRVTQLASGRLLVPVAYTKDVKKVNHFVSFCYLSDDGGKTWKKGGGHVDMPRRGAMEPEVMELRDGRLMMIVRNQLGYIAASYSRDAGETWSKATSLGVTSPEAPATLRRIPSTGDLLLIWNNTYTAGAGHGGRRTPLTAAISSDEGKTWKHVRNLESSKDHTYSYTSVAFARGRAVMSYWVSGEKGRLSSRFRSLPIAWFYE